MKKVLSLLAITGFVACSNGESTEVKVDSAAMKDSIAKVEAAAKSAADSAAKTAMPADSAAKVAADSAAKTVEAPKH